MTSLIPNAKAQDTGMAAPILSAVAFMLGLSIGVGLVVLSFSFPVAEGSVPWLLVSGLVVTVACLMGLVFCALAEGERQRTQLESMSVPSLVALLEGGPNADPVMMAHDALATLNRCHPGWSARYPT